MVIRSIFKGCIKIDTFSIFYSPAKFSPPKQGFGPVAVSQPIIEEYAGWSMYPDRPPIAIIGLGYEYDRALGVLDYLDVDIKRAVLMMPLSPDERYNAEVKKANKMLLSQVDNNQIVGYNVSSPEDSLIRLNAIISGLVRSNRVIVVPFGPKIFCSLSILSSEILQNKDVTIWTVSGGKHEKPVDRKPSDFVYEIDLKCVSNEHNLHNA